MYIVRKKVHPIFIDRILEKFPILAERDDYRKFLEYLMFGTFIEKHSKCLIITQELLAQIENKPLDGKYRAEDFLVDFRNDVLQDLDWSDWCYVNGKARIVLDKGFDEDLENLIKDELLNIDGDLVYFDNGLKPNPKQTKIERDIITMKAIQKMADAHNADARLLLDYMNNLSTNQFSTQVIKRIDEAYVMAARNNDLHSLSVLRVIESQVQPKYAPSAQQKTVRIFGINESMLLLNKDVRKVLTRDWIDFDLKSAHLAIFAYLFDVEEIKSFLSSNKNNIWMSLFEHYNLPYDQETKRIFKTALYSLVYGKTVKKIYYELDMYFIRDGIERGGKTFFDHPVIKALATARKKAMSDIKKQGYGKTIYGEKLSTKDFSVRSILSQMSQSVELYLLMPVVDLARHHKSHFTITLWQHDGFTVNINGNDKEYWVYLIREVVKDRAIEEGIITELE